MKQIDMTGTRYGHLVAVEYLGASMWRFSCDCGNNLVAQGKNVRRGLTQSCGCHRDKVSGGRFRTHGKNRTRLHNIWRGMRERCNYPLHNRYQWYGGRGIKVCPEWQSSFEAFHGWATANGYSDDLTIDRIDNDRDYGPENCRWASYSEQRRNQPNWRKAA